MRLSTLIRLWIWFSLLALIAYAILYVSDMRLHEATGFGTADLRGAASAAEVKSVFAAWIWTYFTFTRGARLITGDQSLSGWQDRSEAQKADKPTEETATLSS